VLFIVFDVVELDASFRHERIANSSPEVIEVSRRDVSSTNASLKSRSDGRL
jgi:hypothetical protein